ncbi:MAG: ATP-dependent helicase [Candidatus Nanoarchaeia archaeon]|nr:ATP-dependent helicase [Candidatus Nanoarchaeia archaeon]MDD5741380.1 ATP-dependent helicase [Candidatus Nanoarchaeia archaeon]
MEKQIQKYPRAELRKKEELMGILDPLVKEWFFSRFKEFSDAQLYGVMNIHERKNILISAPTGSTKTLTAFLSILNYLVSLARKNELEEKVYAIYASPLKALSNDIFVNLINPLKEIEELAGKQGIRLQKIRVGLRTGDTSVAERAKMAKHPSHIYITTPESLAISLTTKKFIEMFYSVEFVIIDEIHSLGNKRGVYLSISLERLEEISKITPVRIGLSATIAPLDEVANFLAGTGRQCSIAEVETKKKMDIKVLTPITDLIDTNQEDMHSSLYGLIDKLIQEHKTTVVFTNTRAATERVVNHLKEMFPENYIENIGAHHSSLSKEHRFEIEEKLRKGELKVVVTSTSLEMGIDIGYIDLVILLGSPKSSARALQRIGRAGHKLHDISIGRFIVLDRDDLVECTVLSKEAIERKIDKIHIPKNCLDVLSQQIYGMSIQKIWDINEMLALIKKSYCYKDLSREDFMAVISYLAGEYALEHRNVYAKIWYDKETGQIGKKGKLARVIYMTNIGTIPEESFITVVVGQGEKKGSKVGVVDESFLEKMKIGDVFVLGGKKYQFMYTRGMKAYVRAGIKKNPTIPSWFSEMLPLSFDSALEIGRFRKLLNEKFEMKKNKEEIIEFIKQFVYCQDSVAKGIYNYFYEQFKFAKIPNLNRLLIESYKGEKNYVIFHSLYGRRVNDALSRAIGYLMAQKVGRDIEIGINDNGFYFAGESLPIDEALKFLNSENLRAILEEAISKTEILKRRFRHCAARALMILRNYKGRRKTVGRQQVSSFLLLSAINKISKDFPILKEARREVLEDLMDIENAKQIIKNIKDGKINLERVQTKLPSPFALNLIMQGHVDLMRIEDKIEFLKRMHQEHLKEIGEKTE